MQRRLNLEPLLMDAPIGVAVMNFDGDYMAVNHAYARIYGYAIEELLGRSVLIVFPPEMHERVLALHKKFLSEETTLGGEWRVVRRDGSHLWVLSHSVRYNAPDGQLLRLVYVTDISDRKALELALREEEERLQLVLATTSDAVFDVDLRTGQRKYSPSWWTMFGYAENQWPLDGNHWQHLMHPDDLPVMEAEIAQVMQPGVQRSKALEYRFKHNDGSYRYVVSRFYVQREATGSPVRITGTVNDLTATLQAERHYRSIVESTDDAIVSKDLNGRVLTWNRAAERIFGYRSSEMVGQSIRSILPEDRQDEEDLILSRICDGESIDHYETRRTRKDGRQIDVSVTISPIFNEQGEVVGASKVARDITFKKALENRLALTSTVFANTQEGILVVDSRGYVTEINPAFEEMTGYRRGEVIAKRVDKLLDDSYKGLWESKVMQDLARMKCYQGEHWVSRRDGQRLAVYTVINAVAGMRGDEQQYVVMLANITAEKIQREKLEHLAQYDLLTDLPNRHVFQDRLEQAQRIAIRNQTGVALLYVDLDGFKAINDTHGHAAGDALLVAKSSVMREALREVDTLARLGGDEFAAILEGVNDLQECLPVIDRLLNACASPFFHDGAVLSVSASIGVAIAHGSDSNSLANVVTRADQAMYRAKKAGKNCYAI